MRIHKLPEDTPIVSQKIELLSLLRNVTIANCKWPSDIGIFRSGSWSNKNPNAIAVVSIWRRGGADFGDFLFFR
jgi:hypothetical protein